MDKKYLIGILLVIIVAVAWFYLDKKGNLQSADMANVQKVGGDKDEHGCIGSAGYIWSDVRGACIRLFEDGIRMNPKDDTLDQTQSAFVVFKSIKEYQMGELYLPGHATPTIMAFKKGLWADQDNMYRLFENGKNLMLLDSGSRLLYATDNQ